MRTALHQLKAGKVFNAAWAVIETDDQRAMLVLSVLRNVTVGKAAEQIGLTKALGTATLVAALDLLIAHWGVGEPSSRRAA